MKGWLCTQSWAGPTFWSVDILSRGPKRAKVRLRVSAHLGRRWFDKGTVKHVPADAVTTTPPPASHRNGATVFHGDEP